MRTVLGVFLVCLLATAFATSHDIQTKPLNSLPEEELEEVHAGFLRNQGYPENPKIILWDEAKKASHTDRAPKIFRLELKH